MVDIINSIIEFGCERIELVCVCGVEFELEYIGVIFVSFLFFLVTRKKRKQNENL